MKKLTASFLITGTASNSPDIRYATGFVAPDSVVAICQPNKTVLVVSAMEYGRALKQSKDCIVESPDTLGLTAEQQRSVAEWTLAALAKHGISTVDVDATFPLGLARTLEASGISLMISGTSFLKQARQVKTEEEIRHIARAQKAARAAMRAVGKAIAEAEPGRGGVLRWQGKTLTSEIARKIVRGVVLEFNCIDEDTIIAGGVQAADPHEGGSGPLRTGEWIVCDIFPRSLDSGYWGDMTRTFMNGKPSGEQKRLYDAVKSAHDKAMAMLIPGVLGSAVHAKAAASLAESGFSTFTKNGVPHGFIHSTGHGVGLEIHEEPRLSPSGGTLLENMVVTVEPGLYYPDLGGVRIEDLVVIRKTGPQVL